MIRRLLDVKFTELLTPWLLPVVYVMGVVWLVGGGIAAAMSYPDAGRRTLTVVVCLALWTLWRVALEVVKVLFRAAQDIHVLRQLGGLPSPTLAAEQHTAPNDTPVTLEYHDVDSDQ